MSIGKGTNFFDGTSTVQIALTDASGNAVLARGTVANLPSAVSGYAVSCIYQATDSGAIYENTGSATSCTFTLMDTASTSLQLPEAATDATTTTTTSLALTQNAVTTGIGLSQSLNGLTTGQGHLISHTTAVIADGGSLLRVTSSSVDTGGATNGTVFDFKSTGQLAGTMGRIDSIMTTGTVMSIISTGIMTTTGNLLTLTANSATTAAGILRVNATGLSTGNAVVVTTSSNSTNASTSVEPVLFSHTMTGAGGVGGRVRAYMTTNVALGAWSNAFKGEVTYGASGYTTGLGSAICAEMTMAAGTTQGTYAPVEIELNMGSNAPKGTDTSLIYASVNGTATAFLAGGHLMSFQGLGAASSATNIFHTTGIVSATHGLRINIGGVDYDILLKASTYA